jgi:hypothetical protein
MQRGRDSELIFPIKDAASPALVLIKADCLHTAGIINEAEKQYVHSRARTFLDDATLKDAAFQNCPVGTPECVAHHPPEVLLRPCLIESGSNLGSTRSIFVSRQHAATHVTDSNHCFAPKEKPPAMACLGNPGCGCC